MNKEFEELYLEHWRATCFLSSIPMATPTWNKLVEWTKDHKEEALDSIIEMLRKEPNDVVGLCEILFPDTLKSEGFIPLKDWCNMWLNILIAYKEGREFDGNIIYYYKDYDEWNEHLNKHYIPWNPFLDDRDPNVTLEEFQQGKRNTDEEHVEIAKVIQLKLESRRTECKELKGSEYEQSPDGTKKYKINPESKYLNTDGAS